MIAIMIIIYDDAHKDAGSERVWDSTIYPVFCLYGYWRFNLHYVCKVTEPVPAHAAFRPDMTVGGCLAIISLCNGAVNLFCSPQSVTVDLTVSFTMFDSAVFCLACLV